MNTKQEFIRIMNTHTDIALATSVDQQQNVRIVNFYYDSTVNKLYFTSFPENNKVREIEVNPNVAFTTISHSGTEHIKGKGIARKSELTISNIADKFISKIPDYKDMVEMAGDILILFEISPEAATVTLDFENTDTLVFDQ